MCANVLQLVSHICLIRRAPGSNHCGQHESSMTRRYSTNYQITKDNRTAWGWKTSTIHARLLAEFHSQHGVRAPTRCFQPTSPFRHTLASSSQGCTHVELVLECSGWRCYVYTGECLRPRRHSGALKVARVTELTVHHKYTECHTVNRIGHIIKLLIFRIFTSRILSSFAMEVKWP